MSTTVISILNQKGGVGKTTTTISLGHGLALQGKKVLVIDFDPQGQCATQLGLKPAPNVFKFFAKNIPLAENGMVASSRRKNLWILPGDNETRLIEGVYTALRADDLVLDEQLSAALKNSSFDYVIIDTPPTISELHHKIVLASHFVLLPSECAYGSSDGLIKMEKTLLHIAREKGWSGKLLGVLPTKYDPRTRISDETLVFLRNRYGRLCLGEIHKATVFEQCFGAGVTIFEVEGEDLNLYSQRAQQEYSALVDYVLRVKR